MTAARRPGGPRRDGVVVPPLLLPDGLSLLWESGDPSRALQERFGFDGLDAAAAWASTVLDEAWGLRPLGCPRMVISAQKAILWIDTGRGGWVMKWAGDVDRFPALDASTRVLAHLGRRGAPVAAPVPTLDGRERITRPGPRGPISIVLQPELPGQWLDVTDAEAVRAAGVCLAELHQELRGIRDERLPSTSRVEVSAVTRSGLAPAGLPELDVAPQLVHNDYRAANLLTSGAVITGILDFDELSLGQPVGDLAFASVYLATLFTDWRPTEPATRQQLRAGYESVRVLSPAESRWYDVFVAWLAAGLGGDPE